MRASRIAFCSCLSLLGAACGDPDEPGVGGTVAPPISTTASTEPTSVPPSTDPPDGTPPPSTDGPHAGSQILICSDPPFLNDGSTANPDPDLANRVVPLADEHPELFAGVWWDAASREFVFPTATVDEASAFLSEQLPDSTYRVEQVARNADQLRALRARAMELQDIGVQGSGARVWDATVSIELAILDPAALDAVRQQFADDLDAICVTGADPADVPLDGPQPTEGDGWRMLADQVDAGTPYTTGVATTADEYAALWTRVGLAGDPPPVDFTTEIVIHFGAVYSGSCPEIRLDDMVFDQARALVTAEIVRLGGNRICTDDANPRAYVVAVERSALPPPPFTVALEPDCDWCDSVEVTELTSPAEPPGSPLSETDLVGILAAAAAYRVGAGNSFGGQDVFDTVEVIEVLGRATGDGFIERGAGSAMTDAEREAIVAALAPRTVRFVAEPDYGDLQPPAGFAIIELAEPAELDGQLTITSSVWCGGLCGMGGANALVRNDDGTWKIGEPVGPSWIS